MDDVPVAMKAQDGVLCRAQALAADLTDADIRRRVRRREWAVVHPGVYVDHTGVPTWRQQAWAAVLVAQPAVLGGRAALAAYGVRLPGSIEPRPIEITVPTARKVRPPEGILVRRSDDTFGRAVHTLSPPRLHSALEHEYLVRVERPHGLPVGTRQVREDGVRRDVVYLAYGFAVELDSVKYHTETLARDADLDRDLVRQLAGSDGVRLGWGQVVERACLSAARVGRLLQRRGWTGTVRTAACCRRR